MLSELKTIYTSKLTDRDYKYLDSPKFALEVAKKYHKVLDICNGGDKNVAIILGAMIYEKIFK